MATLEASTALWFAFLAVPVLLSTIDAQRGTVLPSTDITFGSYSPSLTICYSNSAVTSGHRLAPARRSFSFVPTAAQKAVQFIEIESTDGQKFYAQIINGGIGTVNAGGATDILVSAVHNGNIAVHVRIFCG